MGATFDATGLETGQSFHSAFCPMLPARHRFPRQVWRVPRGI